MELDLSVLDVSPVSSGSKAHKRFAARWIESSEDFGRPHA
jgi:hypothetical protein